MLNELKKDLLKYRKAKNTENVKILSTVIGEVQTLETRDRSKELKDSDIIRVIDKTIQGLEERNSILPSEELSYEIQFLMGYVPKKLTEEELLKIKEDNSFESAREMMPFLKKHYEGLYDGKLASKVSNS